MIILMESYITMLNGKNKITMKTKQNNSLMLVIALMICLIVPNKSWAEDCLVDGIFYNLDFESKAAGVASDYNLYSSCYSGDVIIPESIVYAGQTYSVTWIDYAAFAVNEFSYINSGLTSVTIPNSVTSIAPYAFRNCTGLTSMTLPNSVTKLGEAAFYGCINLKTVIIGSGLNQIDTADGSPFCGCTSLASIIIDPNNKIFDSRDNCVAIIETSTNTLIAGCENTKIPNSVTSIGYRAFRKCRNLTSLTIPNSVTNISGGAFSSCTGLTSVTIPNRVTSIGERAFSDCTGLTSVTIPNSVVEIGSSAFSGCTGLTSITVEGVTPASISSSVFSNVDKTNCTLYVPAGSKSAYQSANGWSEFQNIEESPVLVGTLYYNLIISDKTAIVDGIADKEYSGSLTIPESINYAGITYLVTTIGAKAFYDCTSLTSVEIPNSVTNIGGGAFLGCSGLTSVTIPNSVTTIGNSAFRECTDLTSVEIPNSVTNIEWGAFAECTSLTSVEIPNSVTSISEITFLDCTGLTSVEIPNSVVEIGNEAFSRCTSLTSVEIPNSVTSIGEGAFYDCTGLTSIVIPNSVTNIEVGAFAGCTGLTSVTIPSSVTSIGISAFSGCTGLTSIFAESEKPISISNYVFQQVDKSICTLFVPKGSKLAYENAVVWNEFEHIVEYGEEEPDTDLSAYDNVVYIEGTEVLVGQQVRLSLKMNNTIAPTGFQCDVYLPDGVTATQDEDGFYLMDISTERTTKKKTDYSNSAMQSDGGLRFMCSSTKSYTFSGNEGEVAYLMVDIDSNIEEGTYPLILKNIEISDANSNAYRVSYVKTTLAISSYTLGDANNDGSIGVSDFTAIANYIMGTPPASFVEKAADVNVDGVISVSDLTGEANIILYGTVTPNASYAKARDEATAKYASFGAKDVTAATDKEFTVAVSINGNYAYSGYQFDVALPEGMTVKDVYGQRKATDVFMSGMIDDNTLRVLCASTMGETTESSVVYLTLEAESAGTYSMDIDNAIVSANSSTYTMSNSSFLVSIDNDATGISDLGDEASRNDMVYDLTGRKLMSNGSKSSLQKGIYIINGHKITK